MNTARILALMAVCAMAIQSAAVADPAVISVMAQLEGGTPPDEFEDSIMGDHKFGSTDRFDSEMFPGFGFEVEVSSSVSDDPAYDWQVSMDFTDFAVNDFAPGTMAIQLEGIKPVGTGNPIDSAAIFDGFGDPMDGDVMFDDGNIFVEGTVGDLVDGDDIITIRWTQVPEPATLSLLALGGWSLINRRRR